MRGIEELDHYEMLEIACSASPGEIDRAYRLAQQTYGEDSLALYSIFDRRDASEIRARLDEAYRVLADPELRASYDRVRVSAQGANGAVAAKASQSAASASAGGSRSRGASPMGDRSPVDVRHGDFDSAVPGSRPSAGRASGQSAGRAAVNGVAEPIPGRGLDASAQRAAAEASAVDRPDDDEAGGEFDGPRLRRTRLFRGYEIDQIADVTKISGLHLRNIEDENFAELPAEVYVRGFVTAYAKMIGLDPLNVVPGYMARLQESRQKNQRSRFLGLR